MTIAATDTSPKTELTDVLIIGAGPSGALAASLLHQQGHKVLVLEKQYFPRFSIGESLLPCCMQFIEEAGMLDAVNNAGFQYKNGAAFNSQGRYITFDFTEKYTPGPGTTFQVQRGKFDKLLADTAQSQGVEIRYGQEVIDVDLSAKPLVQVKSDQGRKYQIQAKYILDASGFGRVLPKLLDLERPSNLASRCAIFTHIRDNINDGRFDRNKILISVHPDHKDVWYWLIPFSDGTSSIGVVAEPHLLEHLSGTLEEQLLTITRQEPYLEKILQHAEIIQTVNKLQGYSANVTRLATDKFALLGNAGEFLDPVFSSGVTIAMQSASMAAKSLHRQLQGQKVDWQAEYAKPLSQGVDTFRTYVEAWYDTRFQDVIFYENPNPKIKEMICSILAGYAWDNNNPFVIESQRRLDMVVNLCK